MRKIGTGLHFTMNFWFRFIKLSIFDVCFISSFNAAVAAPNCITISPFYMFYDEIILDKVTFGKLMRYFYTNNTGNIRSAVVYQIFCYWGGGILLNILQMKASAGIDHRKTKIIHVQMKGEV